jgi:hypothetical protein
MECGLCRSGRTGRPARAEVWRWPRGCEFEMTGSGRGGKTVPLGYQEPIRCNAERGVMVEPSPVTAFEMTEAQLLFQFLIIAFHDPALFRHLDQSFELGAGRQRRDLILGRFWFPCRPFDQQPFLSVGFRLPIIPMRGPDSNRGKTGSQLPIGSFSPGEILVGCGR